MSGSASTLGMGCRSYSSLASAGGGREGGGRGWGWRGGGEKERLQLLHRALRLVGRRRAGVLLLLAAASAAVFCSIFAVVKGLYALCPFLLAAANWLPALNSRRKLPSLAAVRSEMGICTSSLCRSRSARLQKSRLVLCLCDALNIGNQ